MSQDPSKQKPADWSADAGLQQALNSLEEILEGKERAEPEPVSETRQAAPPVTDDAQYTIPLLEDVVSRAPTASEPPAPTPPPREPVGSIVADPECQSIIERLSSEIEVIVQASVDEAMSRANEQIAERVRDHIDIILPEILDEIAQIRARKRS